MKISDLKKDKISEQILALLYSNYPKLLFTSHVASEIIRDEEFIKKLLLNLLKKGFVAEIKRNSKGAIYLRRSRWTLSDRTYEAYKKHQPN